MRNMFSSTSSKKRGLDVQTLQPRIVAGNGRSISILELLLAHGWDINWRNTSSSTVDAEPFMWHIVDDGKLVAWCLDHDASVFPKHQEPLQDDEITISQMICSQVLERAAARADVETFELLRSKGAPLGWRPLHLAVQTAAFHTRREETETGFEEMEPSRARMLEKRMDMVRHLIDVVGLDVNAPDYPGGRKYQDRLGTPICYLAHEEGLHHTKELTWLLLDRGADPTPGLEEAESSGHETFAKDVEAWKAQCGSSSQRSDSGKCIVQ
ncbi:hypothetical protein N0V90_011297 [Kalmusia sp. IMI 367209]|nr:hypothetical protein N0V90_011297 [Kalmusia sp. IMI 367209]